MSVSMWTKLFLAAVVMALSGGALAQDPPQMLHIAFRGTGADVVVSWATNAATASSTVKYGAAPSALTSSATGSGHSYYQLFNHDVVLVGLAPATLYYYMCGDAAAGWSTVYSFESPRTAGDAAPCVRRRALPVMFPSLPTAAAAAAAIMMSTCNGSHLRRWPRPLFAYVCLCICVSVFACLCSSDSPSRCTVTWARRRARRRSRRSLRGGRPITSCFTSATLGTRMTTSTRATLSRSGTSGRE